MRHATNRLVKFLVMAALVVAPATGCAANPPAEPQPSEASAAQTGESAAEPAAGQEAAASQEAAGQEAAASQESATGTGATDAPVAQPVTQNLVPIGQGANRENFEQLLLELVSSYEMGSSDGSQAMEDTLAAIRQVAEPDYAVAQSIVSNWQAVFANPNYQLIMFGGGDLSSELAQTGIQDAPTHAFVVMGYELVDGEMDEELMARCDAAAAAARSYPNAIIVCSGGATGFNNPEGHTEAGMMREYLVETCGIDPARIHIDETSQDTAQNAANTMAILRGQGVQTFTIVTSAYHQAWAQAVYNAAAALSARDYGTQVTIVGNYNVDFPLTEVALGTEDRWAAEQMADVLGLPKEEMQALLWV